MEKGFSILSTVVALMITITSSIYFLRTLSASQKKSLDLKQSLSADLMATELLDFFAAQSRAELLRYLTENPNGTGSPYKLCETVNKLDRETGQVSNRDTLADLDSAVLLGGSDPKLRPNRFYKVQVIDLITLETKANPFCSLLPSEITIASNEILVPPAPPVAPPPYPTMPDMPTMPPMPGMPLMPPPPTGQREIGTTGTLLAEMPGMPSMPPTTMPPTTMPPMPPTTMPPTTTIPTTPPTTPVPPTTPPMPPPTVSYPPNTLQPHYKFLVTVGLSWVPNNQKSSDAKEIILSTVIAE